MVTWGNADEPKKIPTTASIIDSDFLPLISNLSYGIWDATPARTMHAERSALYYNSRLMSRTFCRCPISTGVNRGRDGFHATFYPVRDSSQFGGSWPRYSEQGHDGWSFNAGDLTIRPDYFQILEILGCHIAKSEMSTGRKTREVAAANPDRTI